MGVEQPDDALGIEAAVVALRGAAAQPSMQREPMVLILHALELVLGAQGKVAVAFEQTAAEVAAEREPISADDFGRLAEAMRTGAHNAMRLEGPRTLRRFDRAQAVQAGLFCGGAFVLGALAVLGVQARYSLATFSTDAQVLSAWHDLARDNPDPRSALMHSATKSDPLTGRHYYGGVSLWAEPAPPPPVTTAKP